VAIVVEIVLDGLGNTNDVDVFRDGDTERLDEGAGEALDREVVTLLEEARINFVEEVVAEFPDEVDGVRPGCPGTGSPDARKVLVESGEEGLGGA
jgi:hypothetical protein